MINHKCLFTQEQTDMYDMVLQAHSIACMQGDALLFEDVTFEVASGDCLQVVGPNGCGKTSLLKIIVGLLSPWQGEVTWCGSALKSIRPEYYQQLIYIGHKLAIKRDLTVVENLSQSLLPLSKSIEAINAVLVQVQLEQCADLTCAQLSRGQCQRVALARLLLSDARVWVLDEPFTGLDSDFIVLLQRWMVDHLNCGGLIIMSTHQPTSIDNLIVKTLCMPSRTNVDQLEDIL